MLTIEPRGDGTWLVRSGETLFRSAADATDILSLAFGERATKLLIPKEAVAAEFFDLKTGIAGEALQKFANYRVSVAFFGDFSGVTSKALKDFIRESNRGGGVLFVATAEEAATQLTIDNG